MNDEQNHHRDEIRTTSPRIWGEWKPMFFGSGTTIVLQDEFKHKPHLYVYPDCSIDEARYMRDRYAMCYSLAEFMNGGDRPAWLDDFYRVSENGIESLSGAKTYATGPCIDRNPPRLDWVVDESDECRNDRARLIDVLELANRSDDEKEKNSG